MRLTFCTNKFIYPLFFFNINSLLNSRILVKITNKTVSFAEEKFSLRQNDQDKLCTLETTNHSIQKSHGKFLLKKTAYLLTYVTWLAYFLGYVRKSSQKNHFIVGVAIFYFFLLSFPSILTFNHEKGWRMIIIGYSILLSDL